MNETNPSNDEASQNSDEWKSWPPEFFLTVLVAELRTPLTAIMGYVTILADEKMKERHPQALEIISKKIQNLENLCEGIVAYRNELQARNNTSNLE